jgi:hypothetical protein
MEILLINHSQYLQFTRLCLRPPSIFAYTLPYFREFGIRDKQRMRWFEIEPGHPFFAWIRWWIAIVIGEIHFNSHLEEFRVQDLSWCGVVHFATAVDKLIRHKPWPLALRWGWG